jgi:hypothetical protein
MNSSGFVELGPVMALPQFPAKACKRPFLRALPIVLRQSLASLREGN